jgi:hypothetical protein
MSPHWEQFIYTYPDLIAEMIYTCSDHIINKREKWKRQIMEKYIEIVVE